MPPARGSAHSSSYCISSRYAGSVAQGAGVLRAGRHAVLPAAYGTLPCRRRALRGGRRRGRARAARRPRARSIRAARPDLPSPHAPRAAPCRPWTPARSPRALEIHILDERRPKAWPAPAAMLRTGRRDRAAAPGSAAARVEAGATVLDRRPPAAPASIQASLEEKPRARGRAHLVTHVVPALGQSCESTTRVEKNK